VPKAITWDWDTSDSSTLGRIAEAGVVGTVACWLIAMLAGVVKPDYNPVSDSISGLMIGPRAWLMNLDAVVFGALMLGLALVLVARLGRTFLSTIGLALFTLWGLGLIAAGVFPTDPATVTRQTLHSSIHDASFVTLTLGLALSCCVLAPCFRSETRWCGFSARSTVAGGAILLLLGLFLYKGDGWQWRGLEERIMFTVMCAWVEMLALRLQHLTVAKESGQVVTSALPGT